jgi:hypothetical protein
LEGFFRRYLALFFFLGYNIIINNYYGDKTAAYSIEVADPYGIGGGGDGGSGGDGDGSGIGIIWH